MMSAACKSPIATAIEHSIRAFLVLPPIQQSAKRAPDRFTGNQEPRLDELLEDPILGQLLASDGVAMDDLLTLVGTVQTALKRGKAA
jgi:hypothetical protein